MLAWLRRLLRRRPEGEEGAEEGRGAGEPGSPEGEGAGGQMVVPEAPAPRSWVGAWPERPRFVLVGADKGGCGKSMVSGSLAYIVAACNPGEWRRIFLVDTDFLNPLPLSSRVLRRGVVGEIPPDMEYTSFSEIVTIGVGERVLPVVASPRLTTCRGEVVRRRFLFIPAQPHFITEYYDIVMANEEAREVLRRSIARYETAASTVYPAAVAHRLAQLVSRLESADPYAVVIDAPALSSFAGRNDVYMYLLENVDLFVYVGLVEPTPPSYDQFVHRYGSFLDKTVVVLNRVRPTHLDRPQVQRFISELARDGVPVFIVPESERDARVYDGQGVVPATYMDSPVARNLGALALFLGLAGEECRGTGCWELYERALEAQMRLLQTLGLRRLRAAGGAGVEPAEEGLV